jgi:hypothetical protein
VDGIWPSTESLKDAIAADKIPYKYIDRTKLWIKKTVKKNLLPDQISAAEWLGVPNLRWKYDYLLGSIKSDGKIGIQFQASESEIGITFTGPILSQPLSDKLTEKDVVRIVSQYLQIPEEKKSAMRVAVASSQIGDETIYHGVAKCEWNDIDTLGNRWWSFIPFWIKKDKLFVSLFTVDWAANEKPPAVKTWNLQPKVTSGTTKPAGG